MNYRLASYILLLLICFSLNQKRLYAQEEDQQNAQKTSGLIYLPIFGYAPETKFMFGAALSYYFREPGSKPDSRPSTITPVFTFTQKKQIVSELAVDIYLMDEKYHFNSGLSFVRFPNKFYGIGNDTPKEIEEKYTPESSLIAVTFIKRMRPGFFLGLHYEAANSRIKDFEENGLLVPGKILGSRGGTSSGGGIIADWDTRDNIYSPTTGNFFHFSSYTYKKFLGGVYIFNKYNIDMRRYFTVMYSHTIAVQAYMNIITGNPPFQMMSQMGGSRIMRGYYPGRYRDNSLMAIQLEYRTPIVNRLGFVLFGGVGDVAGRLSKFKADEFKHSVGFGLRFLYTPGIKLNTRMDFGFGVNSTGFYLTIREAF
jgi:hypothetical protein